MEKKILIKSKDDEIVKPGVLKTVKELGMPFFGRPFSNGNLYIDFDIIFPEKLDEDETKKITEILKGVKLNKNDMSDGKEETYFLSNYKIEDENTNFKGGKGTGSHKNDDNEGQGAEDDDEESRHGHRTMNCAHQ